MDSPIGLNRNKAAALLGVAPSTIDTWRDQGLIRGHKMGTARTSLVLYAVPDLYRLVGLNPDGTPINDEEQSEP